MNVMKMTSSTKNMKTNKKGLQETKISKKKTILLYTKKVTFFIFCSFLNWNLLQDSKTRALVKLVIKKNLNLVF